MSKMVLLKNRPRRRQGGQPSVIRSRFTSFRNQEEKALHVPMFKSNIIVNHTYRFVSNAIQANKVISTQNIFAAIGVITSVLNTTATHIAESFKVTRLKAWAPPTTVAGVVGAATVSVEWTGNAANELYGSSLEVSDTSINPACPAFISSAPPKGCAASFWNLDNGVSTPMFSLSYPAGTILDLSLQYALLDDNAVKGTYTFTSGAATLGNMYYISLDSGGNSLIPVSKSTNF